jgi:hypothetical protein
MSQNSDLELGKVIGLLEAVRDEVHAVKGQQQALDKRLDEIESKLKSVTVVARVVRWVGAIIFAALTLKFGDIPNIWRNL